MNRIAALVYPYAVIFIVLIYVAPLILFIVTGDFTADFRNMYGMEEDSLVPAVIYITRSFVGL